MNASKKSARYVVAQTTWNNNLLPRDILIFNGHQAISRPQMAKKKRNEWMVGEVLSSMVR